MLDATDVPCPAPIGYVEAPTAKEAGANNAVSLGGWALGRAGIARVSIEREPRVGDTAALLNARGLVPLGDAIIRVGTRPDIAAAYSDYPDLHRATWDYELRREHISPNENFRVVVHAIAFATGGEAWTDLGTREIVFSVAKSAPPYLFCARPFDSVYITSNGSIYPYPDCRAEAPFGHLGEGGSSFEEVWFGADFMDLRNRIVERDPPGMCLTCAHFINRHPNDDTYFQPR